MAIVIKEIILSDSIEKFMEKVNFNFDQLMLAGGGPQGPQGNIGPIGPIGPIGDPGNKWYVGCTGTTVAIGASLFMGDLFLQKGCTGATYSLGDVLEFDAISDTFIPTGLNLRGPTGAIGPTGESTGWDVYPGGTDGLIYDGGETAGAAGATTSFVLLKGDSFGSTGMAQHPGYSRDSLYLGGYHGMYNQSIVYSPDTLPKLFVSPKTLISNSTFFDDTSGGKAGGGITLTREPSRSGTAPYSYTPINPSSYSNIFIDDMMNLNISNFSDYASAVIFDPSINNDINLMGRTGVKLIGGHYQPQNAGGLLEVSSGLKTELYPDTSGIFPAGGPGFHLRSKGNLNTGTISLSDTNQLRIISERVSANTNLVDVAYWADVTLLSPNNKYRIGIGANAKYKNVTSQNNDMPFIGSGAFDDSATEYIGLGNKPTGNKAPTLSTFNYDSKDFVLIGDPNSYDPSTDLSTIIEKSIDIEGQIRMRHSSGSTGQVLLTVDNIGTAEWSSSTSLGGWQPDTGCVYKIVITERNSRFASFIPGAASNYTRVDIPSTNNSTSVQSDLYFADNSYDGEDDRDQQGHLINKSYIDATQNGIFSISTGLLTNCPDGIAERETQGNSTVIPRLQFGAYGEIAIGNLTANARFSSSGWKNGIINDVAQIDSSTTLKKGLLTDALKIYKSRSTFETVDTNLRYNRANIHLINTNIDGDVGRYGDFINPKIKFTPNDINASDDDLLTGDNDGFDSTTSFEVLRYYNGDSAGPGNIRFSGVGKSTKIANPSDASIANANPSTVTTGRGEDIGVGAHVMMISDTDSKNKYDEQGKASDYYEIVDTDLYVETLSATYLSQGTKGATGASAQYQYKQYEFAKWGTAASGWDTFGATGYAKFQGSRTIAENIDDLPDVPIDVNLLDTTNIWAVTGPDTIETLPDSGSTSGYWNPDHLNAWISPTTGVRFSPINLSVPEGSNQTGLSWVDFNIDMGLIFETNSNNTVPTASVWNNTYPGIGYGLFSNNAFNKSPALASTFKVKHLKIKIDPNNLGITSFLDNLDYTRRRNPNDASSDFTGLTNNKATLVSGGEYYTDWYVGQVKPMNNLRGLGLNGTDGYNSDVQRQHVDSSGSMSWLYYSTSNKIIPFTNTTGIPPAVLSYLPANMENRGAEVNWFAHSNSNFANTNKYTTFMWRIYAGYGASEDVPTHCYLEIYCTPPAHRSYGEDFADSNNLVAPAGNSFLSVQEASGNVNVLSNRGIGFLNEYGMQQQRGGFYPNVLTMFNSYLDDDPSGYVERMNLEGLLTWMDRTDGFYGSHGFSLSGQATVKWNRAANAW